MNSEVIYRGGNLSPVCSPQLCLDTHYWTAVNQFFVWGSLSAYFAITFTMYSNGMFLIFTSTFPFIGESCAPCW